MLTLAVLGALSGVLSAEGTAPSTPDFTTEVRPILSRYCFKCHGPDEKTRKGGLRLDLRDETLKPAKTGDIAIVPHQPDKSALVARIETHDPDEIMPPPDSKMTITAEQKEILKRWVAGGAEYKQHWAFIKPQQVRPPKAGNGMPEAANPIDAFIRAKLKDQGFAPSPPADAVTLVRRLYLDLIGLPPKPEEVDAFVQAASRDQEAAIQTTVDALLASPQYGERWARRWLDLARYADTNGYEKDRERSIWSYRDWVVRALNADMPFDEFTIEQVAGDMLPAATVDQRIATGFHRNTMLNEEGGIDPLEFRYYAMADRVATTGTTWLGLTLGCAQCHTHKYDPVTHVEYFQIMAFLNNADEPDLNLPVQEEPEAKQKRLEQLAQQTAALPTKWPGEKSDSAEIRRLLAEVAFQRWLEKMRGDKVDWQVLRPTGMKTNMPHLTQLPDGSVLGSGDITKSDTYELKFRPSTQGITAIRLEALPHPSLPDHGPGLAYYEGPKGDFFMGEFQVTTNGKAVKINRASETYARNNFGGPNTPAVSAMAAVDGDPQTGWSCAKRPGEANEAVFVFEKPLEGTEEISVKMLFGRHYACSLGRFRISVTTHASGAEARGIPHKLEPLLAIPDAALKPAQRNQLRTHFLMNAPEVAGAADTIRALRKPSVAPVSLVMRERPASNPRTTYLYNRGEYTQPQEQVKAEVLSVLNPLPKEAPRNRLAFARWLVSPENPLTARVTVNRQWEILFGRGLVKTSQDFGFQGEVPSHPELLDWLAVEFMKQGWSLKKLHRLIVTSATYQQSSQVTPELLAKDAENKWLARASRPRVEAEIVRDSVLYASGLLSLKMGGPGVYPPQPDGVVDIAYGKSTWEASSGDDRHRRSLYTFLKRTAPFAMSTTFDAPSGEACVARRDVSNTPLQALTLLNDIFMVEATQSLGALASQQPGTDEAKLQFMFRRVLCRQAGADEVAALIEYLEAQRKRIRSGELDAAVISGNKDAREIDRAAWTLLGRALFNLDEFVTKG
ncbi:cytochrome c [Roseimicrobium gellanilyticum]|uniref:Cytochrome c n=2 Tax=Roseimicrobium gellanilyticum TaxID=748857 RepID=A0A366H2Q0_9BACT|nr:cytochrome c [Roseimicrobium gellanilyticum]